MISEDCKYSYYPKIYDRSLATSMRRTHIVCMTELHIILNEHKIKRIVGYLDGILIQAETRRKAPPLIPVENFYLACYTMDMVKYLWGVNKAIREIICTHLGKTCITEEEMIIQFMAKVLGEL